MGSLQAKGVTVQISGLANNFIAFALIKLSEWAAEDLVGFTAYLRVA